MVKNGFGHPHHLTPKAPLFLREGGGGVWNGGLEILENYGEEA